LQLTIISSEEGRGTLAAHPRRFTYVPLSAINPAGTEEVIKNVEQEVEALKRSGKIPPGLADQYDIQLNTLRNPEVPDCQMILHAGYWPCKGVLARVLRAIQ
jgi:hypothetical protein